MCHRNNSYNDRYINYFENQRGSGMNIYHGAKFQRGYGLASFLKSMWRLAVPIFNSGARSLAQEGLTSGINFANDLMERKNARQSFENRLKETGSNLKRKAEDKLTRMQGAGLKRVKQQRTLQLVASDRERKVVKKKRKSPSSKPNKISKKPKLSKKLRDIFE
jgi:hypothetical protein